MHFKVKQFVYFVLVSCLITPLQAFDTKQVQKLDINCFAQDEKSYLMDKSKSEFFSGLNAGEKYQKIRDGSIEKHFAETFDEVNALKKEDSESNFFTGMSMQERFQKLYDGSFEKHYSKQHDLRKKNLIYKILILEMAIQLTVKIVLHQQTLKVFQHLKRFNRSERALLKRKF